MVRTAGPVGDGGRPDPAAAGTAAEFVDALRRLKHWSGMGFRRLEKAAAADGQVLPRSTITAALSRNTLPREDLVATFVRSCGCDRNEVDRWVAARRRIAATPSVPTSPALLAEPAADGPAVAAGPEPVRCTLPADQAVFVGRDKELEQIATAVASAAQSGGGLIAIHAIDGMPGIGKTSLAVHVAHRLKERFRDRQLFLNLHAHTPGQLPIDPTDALAALLAADGVAAQFLPAAVDARAGLWRDRMAGRRLLLVLDDAACTEQVLPLLPGTPDCLVLVTSRRSLGDLPAAIPMPLDVLAPDAASTMFVRLAPHAAAHPQTVAELVRACGFLPLAISITASLYLRHRSWTIEDLLREVRASTGGLLTMTAENRTVAAVFDLSYQHLPTAQQRLFRLLGLHPGVEIEAYAAAALAGVSLREAQHHLDRLHSEHLLEEPVYRRYRLHDLIRAHAQTLSATVDSADVRQEAVARLLDFYRHTTATALTIAQPYQRRLRGAIPPAASLIPDLPDVRRADLWLDTELANLLATARHAAQHGWPEHTRQLSALLDRHLLIRGRYRDAQSLHQHAFELAGDLRDQPAEMDALTRIGHVHRLSSRHKQAIEHYGRALQIAQDIRDRGGELEALLGLGHTRWMMHDYKLAVDHYERVVQIAQDIRDIGGRGGELQAWLGIGHVEMMVGRYEQAVDHYGRALRIAQDIGDLSGVLQALLGLGHVHRLQGHYEQATGHYGRALRIAQDIGDRIGEMYALNGLGQVDRMLSRHKQAADHYGRALQITQDIGGRGGELQALHGLGHVHLAQHEYHQAAEFFQQLLTHARELHNDNWHLEAMQGLGRLQHAIGRSDLALTHHHKALELATDLAQPADQARAHDGLAHAYWAMRQHHQARQHWQHALDILTSLGTDHTEEIQTNVHSIRANLTAALPARNAAGSGGISSATG
ncbi:ATP-binding protein [Allorhizocola rhizosphaerae]|uniref:ATP-binding protein n=1 Tax=Allorhizocola rhizosphaerae TaxID=1872709 RepID=UPI0013C2FA2D|nr:tetratricopeptide repeat protein [Allorhizocola rhizosphaerae]